MSGDALELALALYRAPILRSALRDRALPADIHLAIQLASAPQPLLHDVAARLHEPEANVLEAVRFYLLQVLFTPDASAYRLLGAQPDASSDRIREHYRWLQRWLHPDRCENEWEALFSARVNWAWHQLQNDARRLAYDATISTAVSLGMGGRSFPGGASPVAVWHPSAIAASSYRSYEHRIWVAAISGCLLFFIGWFTWSLYDRAGPRLERDLIPVRTAPYRPDMQERRPPAAHPIIGATTAVAIQPKEPPIHALQANESEASARTSKRINVERHRATMQKSGTRQSVVATANPLSGARAPKADAQNVPMHAGLDVATMQAQSNNESTTPQLPIVSPLSESAPRPTPDLVARFDLAREQVREVVARLGDASGSTSARNAGNGSSIASERLDAARDLRAREEPGTFVLTSPVWEFSETTASLSATYRVRRQQASGSGRLEVNLIWRGNTWQVTRVDVEPVR